jgi:hypothetical protein
LDDGQTTFGKNVSLATCFRPAKQIHGSHF